MKCNNCDKDLHEAEEVWEHPQIKGRRRLHPVCAGCQEKSIEGFRKSKTKFLFIPQEHKRRFGR